YRSSTPIERSAMRTRLRTDMFFLRSVTRDSRVEREYSVSRDSRAAAWEIRHSSALTNHESFHEHQLLRHRRMDCYRLIELRLRETGLHRNGDDLHDLGRIGADHVGADDAIGRVVDDELVKRALVAVREHVLHGAEIRCIGPNGAQAIASFRFGHPDARQGRVAEHGGGN